ncbi:MAG: hypothetical protein CVT59_05640 [Actinobacteria bacterium HGW-Actinobacteria-1]|jgi:inhibitor of cysteine peptidase|nr:MAG: hypothetical protein CVT59_05640 [Actinobacteria bacterium HGW-Actinobacteria-1]
MRRQLLIGMFVVTCVALVLAGCAKQGPSALSEKDDGSAIEVAAGEQVSVKLPSNPTTGFGWTVADAGPLTQVGESTYEASETKPGVVGAGGTEAFTFKAGTAGSGDLKLEYRRAWEKDVPAEKTWTVTVTVK